MKLLLCIPVFLILAFVAAAQSTSIPAITAVAMDGSKVETSDLRGKIVVFNLWFINCPNCIQEIKLLNAVVDSYKDNRDVIFIGLAASTKPDLEKFLAKNPFEYKIVPNAEITILTKFGTPDKNSEINVLFPMHYVYDRTGKLAIKEQGIKGVEKVKSELSKLTKN